MSLSVEGPSTVVLHKGEGAYSEVQGRQRVTYKLTSKDSRGHFGLYEVVLQPKGITSPHIHRKMCEMFYVLDGELELLAGTQRVTGRQGSFISVPNETVHAFGNTSLQPVKFLLLFCPEINREKFFDGVTEIFKNNPPNAKELREALDAQFDNIRVPDVPFP